MEDHMNLRSTDLTIFTILGIAGAASQSASAAATEAGISAIPKCAMSTQSANTCKPNAQGKLVCHLWAGGAPDQPFVYPYSLILPLQAQGTQVILLWHLLDKSYRFLNVNGGPSRPSLLTTENPLAFFDGSPTNDENGEVASAGPARMYRYRFVQPSYGGTYSYTMAFEYPDSSNSGQWKTMQCDPVIYTLG
jgi:hypothetical protein